MSQGYLFTDVLGHCDNQPHVPEHNPRDRAPGFDTQGRERVGHQEALDTGDTTAPTDRPKLPLPELRGRAMNVWEARDAAIADALQGRYLVDAADNPRVPVTKAARDLYDDHHNRTRGEIG